MVSMAPTTVGAALSATAKRPAPADPVIEPVPKKPDHDAGLAEAIFGHLGICKGFWKDTVVAVVTASRGDGAP